MIVIDTETGGLDPGVHSILSLGACVYPQAPGGPTFEMFVREDPMMVTAGALDVNDIDLRRAAEKPVDVWDRFVSWVRNVEGSTGVILGGHNTPFDIGFLRRLARLAKGSVDGIFSHRYVDTMTVARFFVLSGDLPSGHSCSLASLCATYSVVRTGEHTALGDALATRDLLTEMIAWQRMET